MDEVLSTDKLLPCLLDRLTDHNPAKTKESRGERVMKLTEYREAVLRDIRWLLNCNAHSASDFAGFEEIRQSVLNFGTVDLCGKTSTGLNLHELESRVAEALRLFEPRLSPGSIQVRAFVDEQPNRPNTISLEIRGDLWASPMPETLHLKTEIDLETGEINV